MLTLLKKREVCEAVILTQEDVQHRHQWLKLRDGAVKGSNHISATYEDHILGSLTSSQSFFLFLVQHNRDSDCTNMDMVIKDKIVASY